MEISARLDQPHIIPLYDSGEADGFLFYVMPFVEGESLRDRVEREGPLPVEEAIQIAREVAEALARPEVEAVAADPLRAVNSNEPWDLVLLLDADPTTLRRNRTRTL